MQTCIVQVHDMIGYDIHVRYTERYIMVDICIIYISCLKKIHCTKFGYVCTTLKGKGYKLRQHVHGANSTPV